jgi:peptide/nickel transport system substrate-binding protein
MYTRNRFGALLVVLLLVMAVSVYAAGGQQQATSKGQNLDTLVIAQGADAPSLDPHATNDQPSANIMKQVYDRLIHQTEDLVLQNGLAESYKVISDTVYEFKLRPNVKFHNGETLTSNDVKFTFTRMFEKKAPAAFLFDALDRIEIIDSLTFRFILKKPFAPFITHLGHPSSSILNEKATKAAGDDYGRKPVGTGPFQFTEWKSGDSITLTRFENYYQGPARTKTVRFRFIPENATRSIAIETGEVDIVFGVSPDDWDKLNSLPEVDALRRTGLSSVYLGMNAAKKPFDDVRVRRALNLAVDTVGATRIAYAGGFATPAKGVMPPSVLYSKTDLPGYGFNQAEAKRLLTEAGYPNGFKTTIWVNQNAIRTKYAELFQEQLRQINVEVSIEVLEWSAYLARTAAGEHDMFILGWGTVTGDADYGLYALFHSSQFGNAGNRTFYKNAEVDRLLDLGKVSTDANARRQAYDQAQKLIFEDAPWIFLAFGDELNATRNYVKGFLAHATGSHYLYKVYNE